MTEIFCKNETPAGQKIFILSGFTSTITSAETVNENDEREDPRSNLKASEIHELSHFIKNNNLLLGDKYGADSAGILTANIIESAKIILDL